MRELCPAQFWPLVALLLLAVGGCSWPAQSRRRTSSASPTPPTLAAPPRAQHPRSASPQSVVQPAQFTAPAAAANAPQHAGSSRNASSTIGQSPPESIAAPQAAGPTTRDGRSSYPIDLGTALQLVNAENLQVAFAREQVRQAFVRVDAASVLWLPSVRGGVNYNRHEGAIQAVDGTQFNTSRGAFYTGAGAGVFGAGAPIIPGVYANFHLADAIFQPLAARQFAESRSRAAAATTHDMLLQVSLAYIELQRAGADVTIANESLQLSGELASITAAYARTGVGLAADANRLQAELAVRQNDVLRCDEAAQVNSARLAQLLRLDPTVSLLPVEQFIVPIDMAPCETPVRELVAQGLAHRPELAESRLLVAEAQQRLRREQFAPLIPSVLLGVSYGGMSAGMNQAFAPLSPRLDADALAYWEMRNLGFGEVNARRGAQSVISQAQLRQLSTMDLVAREIVEAHIQVQSRRGRIATANRGVQAAAASHQQNLARIRDAKGLPIEVLQSVQALSQARREYLRAIVDYNTAQFTLHRALGWHGGPALQPTRFMP